MGKGEEEQVRQVIKEPQDAWTYSLELRLPTPPRYRLAEPQGSALDGLGGIPRRQGFEMGAEAWDVIGYGCELVGYDNRYELPHKVERVQGTNVEPRQAPKCRSGETRKREKSLIDGVFQVSSRYRRLGGQTFARARGIVIKEFRGGGVYR
ncbi:hypothetical protein AG1IA_05570 [Rhizoctonia solani AG-1 IA]|uniref:Uncharacterized protein n=1 Tax=Thanatephorus cucumeris (strain AG1-IA) TaxID=983506 RepID=L8WVM2_THACA|nr:hypothetical protein AG1IA_05570 [Rhizoctonia solani AG-1 IA]